MSMLDDVATYLATNGIGTVGTDLYKGFLPDDHDACVALYQTAGQAPVRTMQASAGQAVAVRPRLQVVCRNIPYEFAAAMSKAESINDLLDGLGDVTLGSTRYQWFGAVNAPGAMGRDDAGRVLIVQVFDVVKEG